MDKRPRKFVNIKEWDLPALDDLEENLVHELATKKLAIHLDEETLGSQLYSLMFDRVRMLAQTAVNETITYWIQGLADGHDGRFPELCAEFPYWRHDQNAEPLTVAYFVDNQDGTRTEINRISLRKALMQLVENEGNTDARAHFEQCARTVVAELRELANRLEISAMSYCRR